MGAAAMSSFMLRLGARRMQAVPSRTDVLGGRVVPVILAAPLNPSAYQDRRAGAAPRRRWQLWRSPDDQPPWARPALLGIAALAVVLYAWNIQQAGLAPFYSVAVKSMSVSWKAFFYGAFDPKATITIDKLAGSFLPQALSARIFGFHPWSLALPQVIEGVIAVLVMYRVVRRWAGVVPGLLAAGIFTLTPIAASMFGHSMEDGALTVCLVLAADAYQRAVSQARLRSLVLAGVWVGVGFQAKMLQAWMILPALAIGYLVAAPARLPRRLWQVGVAGVVMLAVSLSWIALYTFTPAGDRPYVDGSTNNSAFAMVFGYNGLERFGISVPGSVTSGPGVTSGRTGVAGATRSAAPVETGAPGGTAVSEGAGAPGETGGLGGFPSSGGTSATDGAGGAPGVGGAGGPPTSGGAGGLPASGGAGGLPAFGGAGGLPTFGGGAGRSGVGLTSASSFGTGWTKLLGNDYAPQIGWLYPLAVLAVIFGLLWTRRAERIDQVRAGFVFFGLWLLTVGLVFSKMSTIPHTAYMSALAAPLAALSGAGIVMFWRAYRAGGLRAWVLPVAVAAELAWTLFLWRDYSGFLPWARAAAAVAGVIAIVVMVVARLSRRVQARLATAGLAAGVVAMLAAPAAWAASVLDTKYGGSSFNASAGPAGAMGGGGGRAPTGGSFAGPRSERFADSILDADTALGADYAALLDGAAGGGAFAGGAGGGITATATTALTSSEQRIYNYVSAHRDGAGYLMAMASWAEASPYILATGQEVMPMGGFSGSVPEPTLAAVEDLVHSGQLRFFLISGTGSGGAGFATGAGGSTSATIDSWVKSACATIPAKDYAATAATAAANGGAETLYECSPSA
jgi:4-amino-4-deoxy-L-arabinose transferase-like glycosyltransferase